MSAEPEVAAGARRLPSPPTARRALGCSLAVAGGFALFVVNTVVEGNLTFIGILAVIVAVLGWRASGAYVEADRVGERPGIMATASPSYLRVYAHALGWPARGPAVAIWGLWLVPTGLAIYVLVSMVVRVALAATP